jgi:glycosyltransferase involved in cell wall biosynthesis
MSESAVRTAEARPAAPAAPRDPGRRPRVLIVSVGHNIFDERVLRTVEAARSLGSCVYAIDREYLEAGLRRDPGLRAETAARLGPGVEVRPLPPARRVRVLDRVTRYWYAYRIAKMARDEAADVVHIHEVGALGLAIAAFVRRLVPGCRIIWDYHDWIPYEVAYETRHSPTVYRWALPRMLAFCRRLAASVDVAVCISPGHARWVEEHLGIRERLVVQNVRARLAPGELEFGPPRRQLVFVGNVMRIRRIEFMIDLLAELSADFPDASLAVCGHVQDEGYHAELVRHARARGVEDRVAFHGRYRSDTELARLVGRGSVGLYLSYPQAFDTGILAIASANKFFTYLALGLPVLLEEGYDNMQAILDEYQAGYRFGGAEECAARVREIWETEGLWDRLSGNAFAAAAAMPAEEYEPALRALYQPALSGGV